MTTHSLTRLAPLALSTLLAGCYSGHPALTGDTENQSGGTDSATATATASGGTDTGGDPAAELPAPTARSHRLTHRQWENTVRDLFYMSDITGLSSGFRDDPFQSGFVFDNNVEALSIDEALWNGYRVAAAQVAETVVADPQILADILPPDGGDANARATAFITQFGRRAFRRPLTPSEITDYETLFAAAPPLYPGVEDFTAGVRMVLDAILQSPHFLYRVENSTVIVDDIIPLAGYEVASRLSYFLWDSMPDDALLDRAEAGDLADAVTVEEEARRLLADARAGEVMASFHRQLLEIETFASLNPSPAYFPNVSAQLGAHAQTEAEMFVEEILFGEKGSFSDLLLSKETHVNAELATLYGVAGTFADNVFERVTLDDRRSGLFTQIGFLAHNASSVNPDPIHRGVFMARHMSCISIAAPPDGVPPLPPVEGKSNRQTVEDHTEADGTACQGCHRPLINPYGFPFENYDAVGAWRDMDNGFAVDASSQVFIGSETVAVDNAVDLMQAMAAEPLVHECYARHWLEFAHGRPYADEDKPLAARIGGDSAAADLPVEELLVGIVTSRGFLSRSTEEL